jgi:hypothetical protein
MSRTTKKAPYVITRKEGKYARKETSRNLRKDNHAYEKELLAYSGNLELADMDVPVYKRTSGWLTW